ncbi:malignant fibrous histiocytoma-amplified sequence 1 homolog [Lingula anatina]|uniref:Malignant fibrous histiocytoma-amplified sequence 1 homolog n=1 Tax=Lingula anatina TaxID=7574 RepID=A0A1S3HSQ9_LINAN|nr:malignant fibrous histiocytoma-amplified sequence 1 homolog [Lingula anatina]|eukprot:XP_013388586.1 malignant fibrous histiocytoma-amplified sequence 1 homolog [Lingula anatina]
MEEPKDRNNSKDISRPIELDLDFLMPSNISESSNLQCLKLSKTNLEVLKIPLSTFWNLKVLDISSNKFTEFPLQVFNVPSLQELNIGHNLLSTIPIDINTLTNLTILKVNDNRFEEFPTHVCDIPALQIFDISGNKIRIIPSSVSKMDSLKTLHIQKNMIDVLPGALCDLYELEYLDMRANHLCTIPKSIRRLTRLQTLNISHNQISAFPTSLCSLFSLENLDIGQNKIDRIPFEIKEIDELKTLKISSNKLIEFPVELCHCEKLETLHIAGNNISSIPPDIANLQTLKIFDIRHNRVSCLPYQLLHLKALTELYVIPNPLTQPPEAVCQNGKGAIFRYLREVRERKAIVVNRLQLNLLGVTGSGKSSLSRSLQRGESSLTAEADRTQVIERGSWEPDSKVAFNINDFGGHDVYRVGYPIFLHKNGVAIITFNLSQYQCEDNYYMKHIGEWIQTVQCRAPGIYIIIVGTHHDLVGDRDPDMLCQDVRHRFKQQADWNMEWLRNRVDAHAFQGRRVSYFSNSHVNIFTISSADMFGMENLSAYLVQLAKLRGVFLPEAWVDVMNEIERMKFEPTTNTLTEGVVREIVKVEVARRKKKSARQADVSIEEENRNQISRIVRRMMCCTSLFHEEAEEINQVASGPQTPHEDDEDISPAQVTYVVQDVLNYMSNTGEVVWFDSNTALGKVIFHKPEVLINLLKSVLHHDFEVKKKALKENYTKQKFEEIVDNLEMRGIIDEDVMEFLWQSFGVPGIERDAMIELMTKLDLSYFVDDASVAKRTGAFHFPCLLQQNEPCDLESSGKWPARLPRGVLLQLTLQIHTPHRCPSDVFEKLSVRIHKYLHMFDRRRIDWNNGVYAVTSRCKILLTRHSEERDWVITTNVRGKDRLAMWDILLKLHQDLVDILKNDWPGVFYSKHLLCPHCIEEGIPSPTLFPGDILDQPDYVPRVKVLPCRNAPPQTISATHVYPALAGRDGVLKENKDRLRRNRVTLVQSVTEQCLLEVLNSLTAQAREKENIMKIATQQERVEEFLDILKNKEDRAFYIFHKHLESSGQTHLADLLRPREEIMDELPSESEDNEGRLSRARKRVRNVASRAASAFRIRRRSRRIAPSARAEELESEVPKGPNQTNNSNKSSAGSPASERTPTPERAESTSSVEEENSLEKTKARLREAQERYETKQDEERVEEIPKEVSRCQTLASIPPQPILGRNQDL